MPTYEYACKECGHRVEAVQSISDPPLHSCGVCGGELRKVFHAAGVLFKGSGFYSTDSRSKPKEKEATGAAKEKKGSSATKEGSSSDASSPSGSRSSGSEGSSSSGSEGSSSSSPKRESSE